MRLAVISPFVDRRHGTERALAELLERLARNHNCVIHLYSQRVEDLSFSDPAEACSQTGGAIFWHRIPLFPGPHLVQFLAWLFANHLCRWWAESFHGARCDLLFSPGINSLRADAVLVHALFHRLRDLSRNSPGPAKENLFRSLHRRAYYRLLVRFERRIYANPRTSLAAVSQRTARLVENTLGRKDVRVIPNAVDCNEFSPTARQSRRVKSRSKLGFREDDCVLLLIGNDWRVKGLPVVLEAMASCRDLSLQLMVVGDDAAGPYQEQADRLGLRNRCHWLAPQPDVLALYAAADVYVSPSLEDSFGLPVAEAMACGLPVITSSLAGVSERIRDAVDGFILSDPMDIRALTALFERLGRDANLRQDLGAAAARSALAWTWDRNAAQVHAWLEFVLAAQAIVVIPSTSRE